MSGIQVMRSSGPSDQGAQWRGGHVTQAMEVAERAAAVLAHRPAGLLTDIDGTISRVTAPPEAATVEPAARAALARLATVLDVVAVVSGRSAADARRLVDVPRLVYIGNHGLERWHDGQVTASPEATRFRDRMARVAAQMQATLTLPGVRVEDKDLTLSIHYRETADPASAEEIVRAALLPVSEAEGLVVRPGRMVFEVRPPITMNKGTAARDLIRERGLRSVVFVGDDVTDLDAMTAIQRLAAEQGLRALTVGVVGPETPPAIAEQADMTVDGVDGVIAFLTALADRLG